VRVPNEQSAAERSRWLAELAEALEQAQKLTWRLGAGEGRTAAAMELYGQLESVRAEVQSLRLRRTALSMAKIDPKWIDLLPWQQSDDTENSA
jgi:hypothetical protein